jgi:hypothetical protein
VTAHGPGGRRINILATTDANGVCRLVDLAPEKIEVIAETDAELVAPVFRLGVFQSEVTRVVDCTAGDGRAEIVVPPVVDAVLATTVNGKPGFPPGLGVTVGVHPAVLDYVDPPRAAWDVEHGEIRFRARRPTKGRELRAYASVPDRPTRWPLLEWDAETHRLFASLDYGATATIVAHVVKPAGGERPWRFEEWRLERRVDATRWESQWKLSTADDGGGDLFENVPVGRYRVRDRLTGVCSDLKDVGPGERIVLSIDLSRSWDLEGDVDVPEGTDRERVIVRREGEGLVFDGDMREGAEQRHVTSFGWRMPGDRPVRIVASHPDLVAAEGEGEVVVTEAVPKVHLRLVAKPSR